MSDKEIEDIAKHAEKLKKSLESVDIKGKLNKYKDYLADLAHKKLKSESLKLRPKRKSKRVSRKHKKSNRKSKRVSRKHRKSNRKSKRVSRKHRKSNRKSKRKSKRVSRKYKKSRKNF